MRTVCLFSRSVTDLLPVSTEFQFSDLSVAFFVRQIRGPISILGECSNYLVEEALMSDL